MSSEVPSISCDVLVIGGGNAGFCAALSAAQSNAGKIVLIDAAPSSWAGGNTYFTAGAFRAVHSGLEDVLPFVSNVDAKTAKSIDLEPYTRDDFIGDFEKVTDGKYDKDLGAELVDHSNGIVKWLHELGLDFELSFNRQAYKMEDRFKFFGGICLRTKDGGAGLVNFHQRAAKSHGVETMYSTSAKSIVNHSTSGGFHVLTEGERKLLQINARALVLAAGGFESSRNMRKQFLGTGWENAYVRGTPYNTGDVLMLALHKLDAKPAGNWSRCHAVAWDANAPQNSGDRQVSNEFTKSGYPLGITVNVEGERFFDEGSDLRNYTYAKFGRAILHQPGGQAFQIWDQKGVEWLRSEEYRDGVVEKIWGDNIEELAEKLMEKGLKDQKKFVHNVREYNDAVNTHRKENSERKWNPAILDGLSTQSSTYGLSIPKSNWALPIKDGPFLAVKVSCGITFTFGGIAIDPKTAGVIQETTGEVIPGIFCAGEMVGGLFYGNYPGGSGLTSGAVFGKKAGASAANFVREDASWVMVQGKVR